MIALDSITVELGALAVATRYRNQQVGFFLIRSFVEMARKKGFLRVVSLTRNQKLKEIYLSVGFNENSSDDLLFRQAKSPSVPMFVYRID
jgi:predicted GNAT family N-acyltransferase